MIKTISKLLHKAQVGKLLSSEINPHPIFFFFIILITKFGLIDITAFSMGLFFIGIVFLLAKGYNYFFYCSPILVSGLPGVSWVGGLVCILWANQTWKVYLYLFVLGTSFVAFDPDFLSIYEIALSVFIMVKTYQGMIFQTPRDNIFFFSGFFSIASISSLVFVMKNSFKHSLTPLNKLMMIPFAIYLGHAIISSRSKRLAFA